MPRRILSALALIVLGIATSFSAAAPSAAQTADPVPAATSGRTFSTGSRANSPEFERSLAVVEPNRAFLPVSADLSNRMPPVGNQGGLGSCTDWAMAYAARSYYSGTLEGRDLTKPANLPSPNFVFHVSRTGPCDDGTSIDDALRVMKKGALSLAEFPYSDKCVPPPPAKVIARASDFRVRAARKLDISRPDDAKGQLARGNPVLIRFNVSSAFQDLTGDMTFTELAPPKGDKNAGWHLMAMVGYDERRQAFRLINSWGTDWGDHGYGWISYNLLKTRIESAYVLEPGPLRPKPVVLPPPPPPPVVKVVPPPPKPVPPTPVVKVFRRRQSLCRQRHCRQRRCRRCQLPWYNRHRRRCRRYRPRWCSHSRNPYRRNRSPSYSRRR